MWRFKLLDLEKRILHWLQVKDFSPLWVKTCTLRLLALANFFSHCRHVKDFSPLWIRMWIFKVPFCVHLISHCLHLKCFSPLWLSKRLFRSPASMHLFSHWLQLAGSTMNEEIHLLSCQHHYTWNHTDYNWKVFLPLWMSRCLFSSPAFVNRYSQMLQLKGFLPLWMRRCFFKKSLVVHL